MSIVPSGVLHWRSIPLLHYPASCKVSLEGNILALIRMRATWMVDPKICYALVSYDKGIFGFQVSISNFWLDQGVCAECDHILLAIGGSVLAV